MIVNDASSHRDVPPPIDLAGHIRDLGRVVLPALIIGLLVGAAVFGLRTAFAAKEYAATVITEITPGRDVMPGDAFVEQLRAPFIGLAQDTNVLNQVLAEVDTGWDAQTLQEHVSLNPGPSPSVLAFTARAESPELAEQIARSLVANVTQASLGNHANKVGQQVGELQAAVAAEQARNYAMAPDDPAKQDSDKRIEDLQGQLARLQATGGDQLSILATPTQDPSPVSPKPIPEASVAALVTFIIAAEALVLLRGRVGKKPNKIWARRVARKYRARFDPADAGMLGLSPLAAATVAQHHRDRQAVLILLGAGASFPTSAVVPDARDEDDRRLLVEAAIDSDWWRTVDISRMTMAIVIVSMSGTDRRAAERALRYLSELGLSAHLVLQRSRPQRRVGSPAPSSEPRHGDVKNHAG